jgi:hypothetical protein
MMDDFKVTRDEARYCRAKAIDRYIYLHPDNLCKWGKAGIGRRKSAKIKDLQLGKEIGRRKSA